MLSACHGGRARQMVEHRYKVHDMSCQHCINAITEELTAVAGVQDVDIDLSTKLVTVKTEDAVTDSQLRKAIEEAGYAVST
jgi:copper chaperone